MKEQATYTTKDVAELLGVRINTIYGMVERKELMPIVNLKNKLLFSKSSIDTLLGINKK